MRVNAISGGTAINHLTVGRSMTKIRQVEYSQSGTPTIEGAGVHLKRIFGYHDVPKFDPFLMLDDFSGEKPDDYKAGFPWHPHRGIETITYMLHGSAEHQDSLGNKGVIGPGDIQWMTAGSGIIHQEMPKGDPQGRMGGFQLWANLPARDKMMDPRYQGILSDQIPEVSPMKGVKVKVIAGQVGDVIGPVKDIVTDPEYLDVSMERDITFDHIVKNRHTVFAYVFEGECSFGDRGPFGKGNLVLFDEGNIVLAKTTDRPTRFLLVSGRPIGEPVAWGGPIVMNTDDQLEDAFKELRAGTFIKAGRTED